MTKESKKEYLLFKLYNELHHSQTIITEVDDLEKILDELENLEDTIHELKRLHSQTGK